MKHNNMEKFEPMLRIKVLNEALEEYLEDMEDVRLYDEAKAELTKDPSGSVTIEDYIDAKGF